MWAYMCFELKSAVKLCVAIHQVYSFNHNSITLFLIEIFVRVMKRHKLKLNENYFRQAEVKTVDIYNNIIKFIDNS
jgi:hypothetical protein